MSSGVQLSLVSFYFTDRSVTIYCVLGRFFNATEWSLKRKAIQNIGDIINVADGAVLVVAHMVY
jgi:hypothetical protein